MFRLRKEARDWFKDLRDREKSFKIDFDSYYFCFLAGIAFPRKRTADDAADLVDHFPANYGPRGKLLVALFLTAELKALGLAFNEKKAVHSAISRFVDPNAPHHMSEEGIREFNKYAHGGYEVLLEWFEDRPRSIDTFLRLFKTKLDEHLGSSYVTDLAISEDGTPL